MKIIKSVTEWGEKLQASLADGKDHLGIGIPQKTEVATGGWEDDIDRAWCEEHGVYIHVQNRDGGPIVYSAGNIVIGFIHDNQQYGEWVCVRMLKDFVGYLQGKELNVDYSHNDVLVDGYKVASGSGYNLPPDYHRCYEGAQIAVNQDMEAIEHACLKPMKKVPKALSDYGVTTEEVKAWVYNWFENYLHQTIV